MALDPLKDLPPRYDVKGGSPRTPPRGIPIAEYQAEYPMQPIYGNGVWKTLAGAAGGLWIMSLLAWWTAFQGKGISSSELHEYVKDYWTPEKTIIASQQSMQDQTLGELKATASKNAADLLNLQNTVRDDERDFTVLKNDVRIKMGQAADVIEDQKKVKK